MAEYLVVCAVAFLASGLTFFSGFGLGTLLLPAFALFFPVDRAVALTGVVHFLNGFFKLMLVWRHVDVRVALRFGIPAIAASFFGALLLVEFADAPALASYSIAGRPAAITPAKLIVGLLLLVFAVAEFAAILPSKGFPARYQPLGGLLSGFFGGMAGMQGALRSAFLIRAGLSKEAFIATGTAIAFVIDVSRLAVYSRAFARHHALIDYPLLVAAVAFAFAGAWLGNRYLHKVALTSVQRVVAFMLLLVAFGLISGLL